MSYESYPTPPPSPYGGPPSPYGGGPYGGGPYGGGPGDPAVAPLRGASFGQAVQRFFGKYAQFRGRASRSEFWWWALAAFIVNVVLNILERASGLFGIIAVLWGLAIIVPELALGARRLHDTNRSGWWQLLALIPIIGWIIVLVWFILPEKPEGARFDV